MIEKSSNRVLEFAGAAVNAAAQLPFGKQREPAFDQVKPGTTGRREMQMEARVPQQPTLNGRGLVGCVVVKNQVQFQFIRHACVNGFKEIAKLDRSMTPMELADNSAGLGIERREQVDGAVALVVGSAALGLAGTHRQQRLTAVECLDLGLLINAQDQRPVRRVQIQTHDVSDFFNKQRVFRKLKTLDAMRLESKCAPDATDRRLAQATALGHRPRAPMGGGHRCALQSQPYHFFNLSVIDFALGAGPRFIEQSGEPAVHEAPAPFADSLFGDPEFARH